MNRLLFILALVVFCASVIYSQGAPVFPIRYTVSTLPAASTMPNRAVVVTDGISPGSCKTGGGTTRTWCYSIGTDWVPLNDVRGGSAKFVDLDFASLSAAVTAIGSTPGDLSITQVGWPDGANVTVPSTLTLRFVNASTLNQTHTVTINGKIETSARQIFAGNGKVIISTITNRNFYSAWWGETTVTVPAPASAPTLLAAPSTGSWGWFTNATTYQIAYTYVTWNGETGLSPVSSFTAKNEQGLAVKPFASLSDNSKYAVGAYVYISPDAGAHWYRGDTPFYRPGIVSFGDDVAGWGGGIVDYSNGTAGATPPAGGTTATTKSGIVVSPPTVAPILTNLAAVGAATYFGAFAYLCADGTESALSPVSSGLATVNRNHIRFQRNGEPPSGAVAVRIYIGTSSTPANLHLQTTVPLHYVTADIHDYNSSGAAPSVGAAQSAISTLQLAYDSMTESGGAGKIIDEGGAFKSPIILRNRNSANAQTPGIQIGGVGGHASIFGSAPNRRFYSGTQTNNVVGVAYSTAMLEWRGLDVRDPNARLSFGLGSCDYFGSGGFESKWSYATFEARKAGGIGYHIPVQAAGSSSHTTSEQHFFETNLIGDAWGISLHGGQTFDIQFNGCEFYSNGRSNSADSGQARIAAGRIAISGWEGTGPTAIGYVFFLTGDVPHVYGNHGSISVDKANLDAIAGSATSYVHISAASINQSGFTLTNSALNSSFSDRYALYAAAPVNFLVQNSGSGGGGNGWINWVNRNDAGADRTVVTETGGSYFGLGSTYGFKISSTSDVGSGLDKVVLSTVNVGGFQLNNDGTPVTTPAQITSNQNDYRPGGLAYLQRWSSDASRNVTGLDVFYGASGPPTSGRRHRIVNVGSNNIVFKHQDAGSTAAYRFINSTGADVTLVPNGFVEVIYDAVTSRWRLDAATAAGGGPSPVSSVFGRTGAVSAAPNDYTWGQIDKTISSLADIATRSASDLNVGTLPDSRLSANVPLLNAANAFSNTGTNSFVGSVLVGSAWPTATFGSAAAGQLAIAKSGTPWLLLNNSAAIGAGNASELYLAAKARNSDSASAYVRMIGGKVNATDADFKSFFQIKTTTAGGSENTGLYMDGGGNVGIGTTNPSNLLHLNATGASTMRLGSGANTNDYGRLDFYGKASGDQVTLGYMTFTNMRASTSVDAAIEVMKEGAGADEKASMQFSTHDGTSLAVRMRLYSSGGFVVGAPTGGDKGTGTVNATAVYDDNVLLTDWVFQKYYHPAFTFTNAGLARRLYSLAETRSFTERENRLPWMPTVAEFERARSVGGMLTRLWHGQEQQQIWIQESDDRIHKLEAEVKELKALLSSQAQTRSTGRGHRSRGRARSLK